MSDKDLNEKNIERACQDEQTRRILNQVINRQLFCPSQHIFKTGPVHLRPHTWVFLRQRDNRKEPITCLGIVFETWDRARFNMIRFTYRSKTDDSEITTSGRLTLLDNGETGIVLDVRWPWTTMLKKFRGLSAGNL